MKKILYTTFGGYPNNNVGGSTKIVNEILKNINYDLYEPFFLSYDFMKKFNSVTQLEQDHEKLVFAQRKIGNKLKDISRFYEKIVTSSSYIRFHYKKRNLFYSRQLRKFSNYDLIHAHDTFSAYYALRLRYPKKILTIHTKGSFVSEIIEGKYNSLSKVFLDELKRKELVAFSQFDIITFPSKGALELFIEDLQIRKVDMSKIRFIYNGVDIDFIKGITTDNILEKYNIDPLGKEYSVLNIAQHVTPKNIDVLIKAVDIIKNKYNKKIIFVNAGAGYLTDNLIGLVNELGLQNDVKFLGMIPNSDVIRFMKIFEYLVMPSDRVVYDMVILEALAAGMTVIASNNGGNIEIIENNVNGYLIDDITPEGVAKKILEAKEISQPKKLITGKSMYEEYNSLYQNLLVNRG